MTLVENAIFFIILFYRFEKIQINFVATSKKTRAENLQRLMLKVEKSVPHLTGQRLGILIDTDPLITVPAKPL